VNGLTVDPQALKKGEEEVVQAKAAAGKAKENKSAADETAKTNASDAKQAIEKSSADAIALESLVKGFSADVANASDAASKSREAAVKAEAGWADAAQEALKKAEELERASQNLATAAAAVEQLKAKPVPVTSGPRWSAVWMALLLAGLFPLSAVAFRLLEVPFLVKQLNEDCKLLGKEDQQYSRRWDASSYAIHYSLAVLATVLGVSLFFRRPDELIGTNILHAMQYGFLGAYVFCVNLVYRRYTTLDLQPHVYMYCTAALITGMVINYVAFGAITSITAANAPAPPTVAGQPTPPAAAGAAADVASEAEPAAPASPRPAAAEEPSFTGVGAGAAAILAFSLGYFPNLAIRWFSRLSRAAVRDRQRRSDALPLSLIDGVSELHEARLQDEGIDNVQNLATTSIPDLVAKTPFTAQEIVEWTDQAVLYLYLDPGEIEGFRRCGLRSVSDFCDIWAISRGRADRRKALSMQLSTTEDRLDNLFQATVQGPNMDLVRAYWNNVQTEAVKTRELLINQVCSRVGKAIRESQRAGEELASAVILSQIAHEMFETFPGAGDDVTDTTPESMYGRAYLEAQLKRFAEARRLYAACIEAFPKDPVAYNDLAWLDLQQSSPRSALLLAHEHALKAVSLAENAQPKPLDELASYMDTLALAEIRLDDPARGFETVKKAIQTWGGLSRRPEPRFLETVVKAGEAFLDLGNEAGAQQVVEFLEDKKNACASVATKNRLAELKAKLASSNGAKGGNGGAGAKSDAEKPNPDAVPVKEAEAARGAEVVKENAAAKEASNKQNP